MFGKLAIGILNATRPPAGTRGFAVQSAWMALAEAGRLREPGAVQDAWSALSRTATAAQASLVIRAVSLVEAAADDASYESAVHGLTTAVYDYCKSPSAKAPFAPPVDVTEQVGSRSAATASPPDPDQLRSREFLRSMGSLDGAQWVRGVLATAVRQDADAVAAADAALLNIMSTLAPASMDEARAVDQQVLAIVEATLPADKVTNDQEKAVRAAMEKVGRMAALAVLLRDHLEPSVFATLYAPFAGVVRQPAQPDDKARPKDDGSALQPSGFARGPS